MKLIDITETFEQDLQDPEFVRFYLEEALNDEQANFLMALRQVIKANKGMTKIAADIDVGRESLYKSLSENGNPNFETVSKVLASLGMKFSIAIRATPRQANAPQQ
ncbi:MAG: addiction module antidote protein [Cyanobacteria bacterium P01_E01_bin.6]